MIVEGINLKKIDQKIARASAKKFGVKEAKANGSGSLATLVKDLKAKLEDSDGDVGKCSVCGAPWPAELDSCPFCGETDNESHSEESERGEESSAAASSVIGGTASEEPPESPSALAVVDHAPATILGGGTEGRVSGPQTEQDLDHAVAMINVGKQHASKGMAQVILTLKRIIDTNLWKLRTSDEGTPLYKSWTEFANKELEFSRTYAERLLKVEKQFGRQLIEELGVNKLIVVVQAPADKKSELIAQARAGLSRQKLQAKAKELNASAGKNPGRGKAAAAPAKKPEKKLPEPKVDPQTVTILTTLGKKHQVKLFRPKKEKGNWVAAKKLSDAGYGWLDFSNGQRLTFQLGQLPTGQLFLAVAAKREA